jgi:hypothetical protein
MMSFGDMTEDVQIVGTSRGGEYSGAQQTHEMSFIVKR